jgi:hypothetical protein
MEHSVLIVCPLLTRLGKNLRLFVCPPFLHVFTIQQASPSWQRKITEVFPLEKMAKLFRPKAFLVKLAGGTFRDLGQQRFVSTVISKAVALLEGLGNT